LSKNGNLTKVICYLRVLLLFFFLNYNITPEPKNGLFPEGEDFSPFSFLKRRKLVVQMGRLVPVGIT